MGLVRGGADAPVRMSQDCLLDSALDMGPLAAVERFLERLFERQSARLFRTAIRPVQVQRRLERTMEGDRSRDGSRTIVPHAFVVRLHGEDLAALRTMAPDLAATLADAALAFARAHGYTLLDRPVVRLRPDARVAAGDIVVDAVDPHARPDHGGGGLDGEPAADGAGHRAGEPARDSAGAPPGRDGT